MAYTAVVSPSTIQQWITEKLDIQKIQESLQALGYDDETIDAHIKEFKKAKYGKQQFTGFICLGAGAFLGFVSCVLTLANPIPELFNIILYGLTSIAILIICIGLYFVLE
jgi:hypothetical protein